MDNKRTPNYMKPTGSASKFIRPRSIRKQDPNSTVCSNIDVSLISSARSLNQTVSRNLNLTLGGPNQSRIKPSMAAPDFDLENDLAYNEYLQALMKQQIIKKTVEEHRNILNDQIFVQNEQLYKLRSTYKEIEDKIESLKQQTGIIELLDKLNIGVTQIEDINEKYNVWKRLDQLSGILTDESNLISVRNIKPIMSQEEYDNLLLMLKNLNKLLERIISSGRNFKEVHHFAETIKTFEELRKIVNETSFKNLELRKKAGIKFLAQASDMFAKQGGYF
ncbi:hypothetical protein GWI33_007920 [Rhynchophorus ferrugineus]|uniref:Uncharacterized protein n=1 Tax=Rhynchophorus ferrugineus TaxID=354439 RepID=A0A834IGZ2_RHYFE|nr:hypothetical protein GWI33_007920 [Rhynchophorus ferrugineus]